MNQPFPDDRSRSRSVQHRLVQAGVVACGVVAGLVEFLALQRRRWLGSHHRAGVHRPDGFRP